MEKQEIITGQGGVISQVARLPVYSFDLGMYQSRLS